MFIRREPRRPFLPRALRVPFRFLRIDLPPPAAAGVAGVDPNNPPNKPPTLFVIFPNMPLEFAPLAGVALAGGADILYYLHILLPKPLKLNDLDARTHAYLQQVKPLRNSARCRGIRQGHRGVYDPPRRPFRASETLSYCHSLGSPQLCLDAVGLDQYPHGEP